MRPKLSPATVITLVLVGCAVRTGTMSTEVGVQAEPSAQQTETARPGLPLPSVQGKLFSASGACAMCHTGLSDETGADVSIDSFWRSTMMANAARDPYWRAAVAAEVAATPALQTVIEDKCATCHMPLARFSIAAEGGKGKILADGFADPKNPLHALASDGVSCTLCHQIRATGFGEPRSFSGGLVIDTSRPAGERETFGPFPVEESLAAAMQAVSGFIPVESDHVKRSELCATCHTLFTPFVDASGRVAGEFPEQMAYPEYLNSDYRHTHSCQSCHMPAATGKVPIASTGGEPRSPFARHVFVGGNAYMGQVLKSHAEDLGVTAGSEDLERTIERATDQLQNRTAKLSIESARLSGSRLLATVVVRSQTGHKFPTGFPARRAWLRFSVSDGRGHLLFESGGFATDGAIVGNDNDADPSKWEPHYLRIDRPDQVQLYETILGDSQGQVTTTLLRGARYLKDNRLLPSGFSKPAATKDIAVHGAATGDSDFAGGGDRIEYVVEVGDGEAPFTATAELLYQSIGYRWVQNLRRYDVPDVSRFLDYYSTVPNRPITIAKASVESR